MPKFSLTEDEVEVQIMKSDAATLDKTAKRASPIEEGGLDDVPLKAMLKRGKIKVEKI